MNSSRRKQKKVAALVGRRFAFLSTAFIFLASTLFAQDRSAELVDQGWGVPERPFTCEMNMMYMDALGNAFRGRIDDHKVLIIVARLGKGETSRSLNSRRLHNALQYQIDRIKIAPEKVILTEGRPIVDGFGRLDFYFNGRLTGSLLMDRTRDFCVACCEERDPLYYPELGRIKKRPK